MAQADPMGFDGSLPYLTAWDGSRFQVVTAGAVDQSATATTLAAYVATNPPPPAPAPPAPSTAINVTPYQFTLLFTPTELVKFAAAQAMVAGLQASDYAAVEGGTGTATQQALVGLQSFMVVYNRMGPNDIIDLTLPEAQSALAILVDLGVVTQARASVILTGVRPS